MIEPLSSVLLRHQPESLDRARRVVSGGAHERERLMRLYRAAFVNRRRDLAFVLAEALTARGLPPCFRFAHPQACPFTKEQQLDLFVHDVHWLATRHPKQREVVNGKRYKRLFDAATATEALRLSASPVECAWTADLEWVREVEYWFNNGERDRSMIVRGLNLSEPQQLELKWLQTVFIERKTQALARRRDAVHEAIMDCRGTTELGMNAEKAKKVLKRRFRLWLCGQMTREGRNVSPASAARLYEQWTGDAVGRVIARRQLEWVAANIPQAR